MILRPPPEGGCGNFSMWHLESCLRQRKFSINVSLLGRQICLNFLFCIGGVLAWRIPGTEEPGGLPSMGSHRLGREWHYLAAAAYAVNNVEIVSGGQRSDSAICTHVSILPQAPFPPRLPGNTEQSPLCCTGSPCWLSMLNIAVCPRPSQTP